MATFPIMTLAEIRTAARQRADMTESQFVTDSEFNFYINGSYAELYDLLIQAYGNDYFAKTHEFQTTDDVDLYDLPADFYKLLGVDLRISPGADGFISIRPFTFSERNRYATANAQTWIGVTNLRYRLNGNKFWLTPSPAQGQGIRLWYVPRVVALTSDTQEVDGYSGWLEYVVVDAAIKAMQKEESDIRVLLAQKEALIKRINSASQNRDAGNPATVADVQFTSGAWPYNAGFGGGGWAP